MRSSFWKLRLGFSTNGLISPLSKALSLNSPKLVFQPQTPNVSFGVWKKFYVKLHKILHQISSYFQIFGHFWRSYESLIPKNPSKVFFLVPFQMCNLPLTLVLKNPVFWSTEFQIYPEPNLKNEPILKSSHQGLSNDLKFK